MNAKTEAQIARMKEQTIGVEVEMNHIRRDKAAQVATDFFGTGRIQNTAFRNLGTALGVLGTSRAENGSSRRT